MAYQFATYEKKGRIGIVTVKEGPVSTPRRSFRDSSTASSLPDGSIGRRSSRRSRVRWPAV